MFNFLKDLSNSFKSSYNILHFHQLHMSVLEDICLFNYCLPNVHKVVTQDFDLYLLSH